MGVEIPNNVSRVSSSKHHAGSNSSELEADEWLDWQDQARAISFAVWLRQPQAA